MDQFGQSFDLNCVASTRNFAFSTPEKPSGKKDALPGEYLAISNYFKEATWTADGTCVITNSADNTIRTFVLPTDLLEQRDQPHELEPYHTIPSTEPSYAMAIYPFYRLQDASSTLLLSSVRDHPIRLTSALYPGFSASYSLVSPTTEAFITPHSILYPPSLSGTQFLTGSDSLICLFDVSRPGKDGPVSRLQTIPSKRKKIVGGGVGMKGIVSTMSISPSGDGVLAAGTSTRYIGLYASNGSGDTIATFSVEGTVAASRIGGKGITQVLWSPCGRYLFVIERKSSGILVYDIRVTGQLVGWLEGRGGMTNQRLKADIVPGDERNATEVWAGGTDGMVRVWSDPSHVTENGRQPQWEKRVHDDPVTSAVFHPMGGVLATCSGQKKYPPVDADGMMEGNANDGNHSDGNMANNIDNSLKIWAL
ncbi:guanine nucleotide-binding protein [Histoplasma capsulatum G186AR]|uniref:Guanine nucleotide-binding protein n=1 Tax=Ajellomyces capsulatus (strain G186AR / H82 / ATCC MYA-2454 / RMSCC 2432) TaxID=447093 RepID=C0NRS6_AJECG|nr:guanine nucleotide-binding protein [Histoplasma capsulatum G186AR]EEH05592.1 guanine nucleotide-binding protein [Histoplasma capsulatum G186AR]